MSASKRRYDFLITIEMESGGVNTDYNYTMPYQLSQIEASLHRAQQSARTGINERYYFDYPRIHSDITTLRSGIEHYLTPSRAQPRDTATLVGQYREEKTAP